MPLLGSITFGQVLLTVLEIALLATWIWVAVSVISDVYRSPDLSSAAKAGWLFAIVLIPLLGVLIYVFARGDKMSEHEIGGVRQLEDLRSRGVLTDEEFERARARQTRRTKASEADDIAALEDLRDHGILTDDEYQRAKEKAAA
ncbi:MAG TPA: SHOCT domain-containing protein [Solirubrobacteraceae bacterium]|nr:SHOCT domain-containing protein [Solirubrobacteraceae bacterium]